MKTGKVLIIEDCPEIAEITSLFLEKEGYTITDVTDTGEDALVSAAINHPDVVISDINLGGRIDGIETANYLSHLFRIPIIFMTGMTDYEILEKAKAAEPYGFLAKPFQKQELLSRVSVAIKAFELNLKIQGEYTGLMPSGIKSMSSYDEGILITNSSGKILYLNPYLENLTGFTNNEMIFKSLSDVICISPKGNKDVLSTDDCDIDFFIQNTIFTDDKMLYLTDRNGDAMMVRVKVIPKKSGDDKTVGAIIALKEVMGVNKAGVRDAAGAVYIAKSQQLSA